MGCAQLTDSYESGRGVTRDLVKAGDLYRRACQSGVGQACEWAQRMEAR